MISSVLPLNDQLTDFICVQIQGLQPSSKQSCGCCICSLDHSQFSSGIGFCCLLSFPGCLYVFTTCKPNQRWPDGRGFGGSCILHARLHFHREDTNIPKVAPAGCARMECFAFAIVLFSSGFPPSLLWFNPILQGRLISHKKAEVNAMTVVKVFPLFYTSWNNSYCSWLVCFCVFPKYTTFTFIDCFLNLFPGISNVVIFSYVHVNGGDRWCTVGFQTHKSWLVLRHDTFLAVFSHHCCPFPLLYSIIPSK